MRCACSRPRLRHQHAYPPDPQRTIVGTYHQLSVKHLDAYLNEVEWRQNNRENKYLFRDTLMKLVTSEALEYRELVAQ